MGQTRSRRNSDSQSAPNVLDLLSQKLRTEPFIPMDSGNQKATMNRKMEAADQEIVSSKGNFNIHIRAP